LTRDIRVFFSSTIRAPFVREDAETLGRHFRVMARIRRGLTALPGIVTGAARSDLVFCWFASVYAFVAVWTARRLGIPSCVVVGGADAARDRELGYGIWLSPWKSVLVRYVFRSATRILVVDPCLKEEAVRLAEYDGANIVCLPTGYDGLFWRPMGEKEPVVLTVAVANDKTTVRRKGLDTLLECARSLPGLTFIIVGTDPAVIAYLHPPMNVTCHSFIPREQLLQFYQRAKVYCQPSRREGLPNALCEAMLCACYPVGSAVSGIPTAIGDTGTLVPAGDQEALRQAIKSAVTGDPRSGERARARIVALFPRERREQGLVSLITGLVQ
jgi:glycosyltransferase involved in cell wall biosynthesis